MAEAPAPPWAGDAGQHKDAEGATAPAPMMFTDSAVTSTLSGQPVLSGAVVGAPGLGGPVPGKSPWQRGTYWRHVGMACALQLLLAVLLLSATLSYMNTEEIWSNEEVVVEVIDGKGEVRMNPDGDLRLSYLSKSYTSADYGTDEWYQNEMWLDYGAVASYDYGYYGGYNYDQTWDAESPRDVMMTYMPIDLNAVTVEVNNDWDNRTMLITTDLWLNHSNTATMFYNSDYWSATYDMTPVAVEDGWVLNYSAAGLEQPCNFERLEVLTPHPELEESERVRVTTYLRNCWGSAPDLMEVYLDLQTNTYGVQVGGWAPSNSTLWFDHEQLGNTTLNLNMEFENVVAWEMDDRRWAAYTTMLTVAPIASLLGLPILAVVGGLRKGRSAAWGAITGFLLMPGSFVFWLWASFAAW
ncbi:MAG TPA: hypothetical protein HA276_08025 [Candidatus Poseidoniaceae archaeon]|nr:MAG TPA: hypothetical protein D7I01_07910 [Candidatus Poseidoniales archaeon]HII97622.1 hypothetical protein [Candidatus Poseidoniaceae archaeon]